MVLLLEFLLGGVLWGMKDKLRDVGGRRLRGYVCFFWGGVQGGGGAYMVDGGVFVRWVGYMGLRGGTYGEGVQEGLCWGGGIALGGMYGGYMGALGVRVMKGWGMWGYREDVRWVGYMGATVCVILGGGVVTWYT